MGVWTNTRSSWAMAAGPHRIQIKGQAVIASLFSFAHGDSRSGAGRRARWLLRCPCCLKKEESTMLALGGRLDGGELPSANKRVPRLPAGFPRGESEGANKRPSRQAPTKQRVERMSRWTTDSRMVCHIVERRAALRCARTGASNDGFESHFRRRKRACHALGG